MPTTRTHAYPTDPACLDLAPLILAEEAAWEIAVYSLGGRVRSVPAVVVVHGRDVREPHVAGVPESRVVSVGQEGRPVRRRLLANGRWGQPTTSKTSHKLSPRGGVGHFENFHEN